MKFLYAAIIIVFAFWAAPAEAQQDYPRDITLSWDWPTLYNDETLIQDGDLRGGDLYCFRNNDFSTAVVDNVPVEMVGLPGDRQSSTFAGVIPQPGTYHCFMTAVTVDGISSDFSNEATRKFTGKPLPPQTFTAP